MASFSTHRGAPYPLTDGFVPTIANNGYRGPEPTLNGPSAGTDEGLESDVNVTFGTGFLDLCGREQCAVERGESMDGTVRRVRCLSDVV